MAERGTRDWWVRSRSAPLVRALLLSAALTLGPGGAAAQTSASEKAAAEALFDEGVALLKKGDYAPACEKLESSQRIDSGVGTLLYLGECYEKLGRTASAWATFREAASAASAAGQRDRARVGEQRAAQLEPRLSKLTIEVAPETRALAGLEVERDGEPVALSLLGAAVPVDPGTHKLAARAPGYEPFELSVEVGGDAALASVAVPALAALPAEEPSVAAAPVAAEPTGSPPRDEPAPRGRGQRVSGLVLGGLGVVGLGVGTAAGLIAIDKNNQALETCASNSCPTDDGSDLTSEAFDAATLSTAAFVAGGVLLATGVVLYVTAPRAQQTTALSVTPTPGGAFVGLGGKF
jgi:serine/threonine-protein kinase